MKQYVVNRPNGFLGELEIKPDDFFVGIAAAPFRFHGPDAPGFGGNAYPIRMKRERYRGNNRDIRARINEANQTIKRIERHVNELIRMQEAPIQQYRYHQIAFDLGLELDVVREHGFGIDGGHNGFTAIKPSMSYDEAINAKRPKDTG